MRGFGACAAVCQFGAIEIVDGIAEITGHCRGCLACIDECPQEAIMEVEPSGLDLDVPWQPGFRQAGHGRH